MYNRRSPTHAFVAAVHPSLFAVKLTVGNHAHPHHAHPPLKCIIMWRSLYERVQKPTSGYKIDDGFLKYFFGHCPWLMKASDRETSILFRTRGRQTDRNSSDGLLGSACVRNMYLSVHLRKAAAVHRARDRRRRRRNCHRSHASVIGGIQAPVDFCRRLPRND